MSYTTHELAKKLLELPDETTFIKCSDGIAYHVKEALLCSCGCEVFIYPEEY